ncbi:MAG: HEPN domain-containing protein [Thermoprotei archaeon]
MQEDFLNEINHAIKLLENAVKMLNARNTEAAIHNVYEAAHLTGRLMLQMKGKNIDNSVSLTEVAYQLSDENLIDEDYLDLLKEISEMREMSHYDIYELYSQNDLIQIIKRIRNLIEKAKHMQH